MLLIAPLVRRNLQGTHHFVAIGPDDAARAPKLPLLEGESIVGWYQNPPPDRSSVAFTDRALLVVNGDDALRLSYRDMTSWRANAEDQGEVTGLFVRCADEWVSIPFAGRRGPDGADVDAYKLATILSAVIRTPRDKLLA